MTQAVSGETVDSEVQTGQEQELETQVEGEQPEGEGGEQVQQPEGEDDEVVVSLGESPAPEDEEEQERVLPTWVKELRKANNQKASELRALKDRLAQYERTGGGQGAEATKPLGEKPTLEGCNYDATTFEAELEAWHQRKREADAQQAEIQAKAKREQEAWQATLVSYEQEKTALKVRDYDEAEETVRAAFSVPQQGVMLHVVEKDKRAALVYALGKNTAKLKELSAITDPLKFSSAITKLEMQLKVTPKKTAPPPERQVRSTVAGVAATDMQLEKLREEAMKTGDLSKVMAFKKQKR